MLFCLIKEQGFKTLSLNEILYDKNFIVFFINLWSRGFLNNFSNGLIEW